MSLDKDAMEHIQNQAIGIHRSEMIDKTDKPIAALPDSMKIHDLEQFMANRSYFRAKMETSHLSTFTKYCGDHMDNNSVLSVDPSEMVANCIMDVKNDTGLALHGKHRAALTMQKTAPYQALLEFSGGGLGRDNGISQHGMAEWLEDWRDFLTPYRFTSDGDVEVMPGYIKNSICAIRSIEIKEVRESGSDVQSLSTTQTALEKIAAESGAGEIPAGFMFACIPYKDLPSRTLQVRLSMTLRHEKPSFKLQIIQSELMVEEMAEELVELIQGKVEKPCIIGSYSL